jgi:hypothetical protein
LEALIKPPIATTTKLYVHRCQTFAKASSQAADILKMSYDLRSRIEHLNDYKDILLGSNDDERNNNFNLCVRRIEALARNVYSRLLTSKTHLDHFKDDISIDAFWSHDDGIRQAIWEPQLDITKIL